MIWRRIRNTVLILFGLFIVLEGSYQLHETYMRWAAGRLFSRLSAELEVPEKAVIRDAVLVGYCGHKNLDVCLETKLRPGLIPVNDSKYTWTSCNDKTSPYCPAYADIQLDRRDIVLENRGLYRKTIYASVYEYNGTPFDLVVSYGTIVPVWHLNLLKHIMAIYHTFPVWADITECFGETNKIFKQEYESVRCHKS